ncbi:hypothetical protein D3C81_1384790 [compost metagenome]
MPLEVGKFYDAKEVYTNPEIAIRALVDNTKSGKTLSYISYDVLKNPSRKDYDKFGLTEEQVDKLFKADPQVSPRFEKIRKVLSGKTVADVIKEVTKTREKQNDLSTRVNMSNEVAVGILLNSMKGKTTNLEVEQGLGAKELSNLESTISNLIYS